MQPPDHNQTQTSPRDAALAPGYPDSPAGHAAQRRRCWSLLLLAVGLLICFARPLYELLWFSLRHELYTHICAVPFISGYFVWMHRKEWTSDFKPARFATLTFAFLGLALVAGYWKARIGGWQLEPQDRLCLVTLGFVCWFVGGWALFLGGRNLRLNAFPLAFLVFLAPLPLALEHWIEVVLQHASADASYLLLKISGTPVFREGTVFIMPGFSINVAPECSGIHSTFVLFIIGLLAGQLFFMRAWTKITLAAAVLVLGVVRNAIRIFTLLQLCLHVDRSILDSPLHHSGGPWFFAGSLVPLLLLILFLRKLERRTTKRG